MGTWYTVTASRTCAYVSSMAGAFVQVAKRGVAGTRLRTGHCVNLEGLLQLRVHQDRQCSLECQCLHWLNLLLQLKLHLQLLLWKALLLSGAKELWPALQARDTAHCSVLSIISGGASPSRSSTHAEHCCLALQLISKAWC